MRTGRPGRKLLVVIGLVAAALALAFVAGNAVTWKTAGDACVLRAPADVGAWNTVSVEHSLVPGRLACVYSRYPATEKVRRELKLRLFP